MPEHFIYHKLAPEPPLTNSSPILDTLDGGTINLQEYAVLQAIKSDKVEPHHIAQELSQKDLLEAYVRSLFQTVEEKTYLLEGSGFDVVKQVTQYLDIYIKGSQQGKDIEEINTEFAEKTRQDLTGFYWEFLVREPILPIDVDLQETNGIKKIVSPKYANTPLEEITSDKFRDGTVKKAITNLSEKVKDASAGTMFIITSPSGWSGVGGNFPESQTYLYKITDNGVEAVTIRTGMQLSHHERLIGINEYDFQPNPPDSVQRIKKVSEKVGETYGQDFEDMIDQIQTIVGSNIAWEDKNGKRIWSFDELRIALKEKDKFKKIDSAVDRLLANAQGRIININEVNEESIKSLSIGLGKIAMQISRAVTFKSQTSQEYIFYNQLIPIDIERMTHRNFVQEAGLIRAKRGCIPESTGVQTNVIDSPTGPREIEFIGNENSFPCPKCEKPIPSGKGITKCPYCGITKEEAGSKCD